MKTLNFLVSKAIPGLIINLDQIMHVRYLRELKSLTIVYSGGDAPYIKEYKDEMAKLLYEELKNYIETR